MEGPKEDIEIAKLKPNYDEDQGDSRESPLHREAERTHHKEVGSDDMLLQQDWLAPEFQTHRQLLQEGCFGDQLPPRQCGQHPLEQHPYIREG